jgi:hypothetical protein
MIRHKWVLIAALSLGAPVFTPANLFAADVRMESVDWNELPRDVQRTFRKEAPGERLTDLVRIEFEGRVSYRASINDHGHERVLRVARDGDIINDKDLDRWGRYRNNRERLQVRETHETVSFRDIPEPARRAISHEIPRRTIDNVEEVRHGDFIYYIVDAENGHRIRVDRDGKLISDNDPKLMAVKAPDRYWAHKDIDRDWADIAAGSPLRFDDLPGEVKQAIGARTHQGDRVTDVVRFRDGDYLATVESDNGKFSKIYRVSRDGKILSVHNATEEGTVPIRYDNLPGPVKDAFAHEGSPRDFRRVLQVTRDGHTYYTGYISDQDGTRVVRVTPRGERLD